MESSSASDSDERRMIPDPIMRRVRKGDNHGRSLGSARTTVTDANVATQVVGEEGPEEMVG
jgi:hypothetical protein